MSFIKNLVFSSMAAVLVVVSAGCGKKSTPDTTPPAAPVISSPANGAIINDSTPDISGTAEAGSTVEVFDGATSLGTTAAAGGVWTFTPGTALAEGAHTLTATARDAASNVSPASAPVMITIDTVAPNAPVITSPANGTATNDATPDISGTAEAGSTVEVFDGATSLGTTTAAGGVWTFTPGTALAEGAHTLTATATDAANNTSPASTAVAITVDTVAPDAPAPPTDNGDYDDATVTFNWIAATDPIPSSGIVSYILQVGTTPGGSDILNLNVGNVLTYDVTGSNGQTLYARVAAVDAAGNQSVFSGNSNGVTVDVTPPSAPGTPVDAGAFDDAAVTFNWTAAVDAQSGIASYVLQVGTSPGGTNVFNGNVGNVTGYTVNAAAFNGQTVYARVQAINGAGLSGAFSPSSDGITVDTAAPAVTVTSSLTNDSTPPLSGTVTETGSGLASLTVTVNAVVYTWPAQVSVAGNAWSIADGVVGPLGDGAHDVVVNATDNVGNAGSDATINELFVDTTPPGAPGTPTDRGAVDDAQVTFNWTLAVDPAPASGIQEYWLQVGTSNVPFNPNVFDALTGSSSGTYTINAAAWHGQTLYARVAAVDVAGNTGGFSGISDGVLVDAQAPWVSWVTPNGPNAGIADNIVIQFSEPMNTASVEAAFSLAPGATNGYVFYWNVANNEVTIVPDTQNPAGASNNDLLAGSTFYAGQVLASATDVVGNPMAAPYSWNFTTRDSTPPNLVSATAGPDDFLLGTVLASNVQNGDTIVFTFNEPIQNAGRVRIKGGSNNNWIYIEASVGGGSMGGALAYNAPNQLILTLGVALPAGTEYEVEVGDVRDANWNWNYFNDLILQVANSGSVDTTPPSVITTIPLNAATNVSRINPIVISFSEPIDVHTVDGISVSGGGLSIDYFETEYDAGEDVSGLLMLIPKAILPASTAITVNIPTSVQDLAGNGLTPPYSFTFTTGTVGDTAGPTIRDTIPRDGDTNAPQWGDIVIGFEDSVTGEYELLSEASIGNADFLVEDDATGLPVRGWVAELGWDKSSVRLTSRYGTGLQTGKTYNVYVGPDISDQADNAMAAQESFQFSVAGGGENVTPYVEGMDVRLSGRTSPSARTLYAELDIRDPGDTDQTVVITDGLPTGVNISSTYSSLPYPSNVRWEYWGGGNWRFQYGDDGPPPSVPTQGMDDANYPFSGLYSFDVTITDDLGISTDYTTEAWVWTPDDCPALGTVDGTSVDPLAAVLTDDPTPTLTWNSDALNADVAGVYVVDTSQLGGDVSNYFYAQMMDGSLETFTIPDVKALPVGIYLWAVVQMKMRPGFGETIGEAWSLDVATMGLEPFFVYGPSNDLLTEGYGIGRFQVNADNSGNFVDANDYTGTYTFDGTTNMAYAGLDAGGGDWSGVELYAYDAVSKELAITNDMVNPGRGWVERAAATEDLILQAQASYTRSPYITVGARRFATTGFDIDSLDGAWCFARFEIDQTGGTFNGAGASVGSIVCDGGVASVTIRNDSGGSGPRTPFDVTYTVEDDGLVTINLDGGRTARGYIGGSAGKEILVVASDNDASHPFYLVMARNYNVQAADNLTGTYQWINLEVEMDAGEFEQARVGRGNVTFDAGGTYTGSGQALDTQGNSGTFTFDGTWTRDAVNDEYTLTGSMGDVTLLRVGPDLDTSMGIGIDTSGNRVSIVIASR